MRTPARRRLGRPGLAGLAVAATLTATLAPGLTPTQVAVAADGDQPAYSAVWNILPPGSNGTATSLDLLALGGSTEATPDTPAHFADQLETYDALTATDPAALTDADIPRLFKSAEFTPDTVAATESPRPGVTIERDSWGVPFITGETFSDVEYGAGYAAIQDRMFLMDVLRHTGAARLTEFVGDSPGNVAMDEAQLRSAYYTPEEAAAQIGIAARRAGPDGPRLLNAVDSFLDGINDAQDALCPSVLADTCPVEYAALQKTPQPWTRADIVYVASLVGGIFGKGGGHEVANAAWYQRLVAAFGPREGLRVYRDLRERHDPEAPVTSTRRTPYLSGPVRPHLAGVALPDLDAPTAPGTGLRAEGAAASRDARGRGAAPSITAPGLTIEMPLRSHGMSNAVLVTGQESATGRPLAVMGPQTGYFAPQLLTEQVLMGPGIQARGVAFAGTNLFVQLGRGVDYAWSATSAGSDNVDIVAVRLCNADGTPATIESTRYVRGKKCVRLDHDVHTEQTTPNAGSPSPSTTYTFDVYRTRHGIVQSRTTVGGEPVALVLQRSTYGHEVDSVLGFSQLNDPGYVRGPQGFQRAASHIDYTFNWFYADDQDISYYSSGLLPQRSPDVDPDFPRWAGARYDWQGWLGFDGHPRDTDPDRGYLVSWNNKPAPGFGAADDNFSYGSVYRSLALEDGVRAAIAGDATVTLPQLVGVMSTAATADSRATSVLPEVLAVIGDRPTGDAQDDAALALLRAWVAGGAPRVDRDRDGAYGDQQAIALFDTWWQDADQSLAYDVIGDRVGDELVRRLPQILDDHPRHGIGSSWNAVAWYGYLDKDLRSVLGRDVRGAYHEGYCGLGKRKDCRATLVASLHAAVQRALTAQGVESVDQLTYDKTQDQIRATTAGVVGVRPIDWQNRPTFQQVVAFTGHR